MDDSYFILNMESVLPMYYCSLNTLIPTCCVFDAMEVNMPMQISDFVVMGRIQTSACGVWCLGCCCSLFWLGQHVRERAQKVSEEAPAENKPILSAHYNIEKALRPTTLLSEHYSC